ncbi:MAG: cytochrome P450 [Sneathiella sp.]|uniref:cytochrome P450 n=1 Tax=Sneathiella sp. TaxID=1964365 RepID=UPI003001C32B
MSDLTDLNVSDPALYHGDAWRSAFARLRQEAPVHYCKDSAYGPYWSVSNYQFIEEAELNSKVFSNRADLGGIQINNIAPNLNRPSFVSMDPPEHTGRRKSVTPMTNRSSLEKFSELIRERTVAVLEALPRGEVFDWADLVSTELTGMMLASMFDFPQDQRRQLIHWSDVATANLLAENAPVTTEDARYAELERMADAFAPLWQQRIGGENFDLITMLANNPATANMDREEFIGTLFLLIVGGNDTTRNSMTGGLLALKENPEELEKVKADRTLIPNMVQEIIRYQTPVIHMRRTALADTELNGQAIAAGDKVVMWYISANRDEEKFEAPEVFNIERENARRHLSFGVGIHRCIGDRLAALQIQVLWEELLARDINVEVVGPTDRLYSNFIRGFNSLLVKITT